MSCDVKRIQKNSAEAVVDRATQAFHQAKTEYVSCLSPQEQSAAHIADAQAEIVAINNEIQPIIFMQDFILKQLKREIAGGETVSTLMESARLESDSLRKKIEELSSTIRTDRRLFLDASPSASTAVGGLYFTQEPDNQVLIAFLSCFGAFLLFTGILVLMNHMPIPYIQDQLTSAGRFQIVITVWILACVLTYIGFYVFT
jgi:hypothetical protein